LLNFHGGGGNAAAHQQYVRMDAPADRANFLVVYPRVGTIIHGGPSAAHSATPMSFSACRDGVEVILWRLTGSGNIWPGGKPGYLTRWLGESTDATDANAEMWRFLQRFTRVH